MNGMRLYNLVQFAPLTGFPGDEKNVALCPYDVIPPLLCANGCASDSSIHPSGNPAVPYSATPCAVGSYMTLCRNLKNT
ncbi:uncharacterized protein LAESUDRAFT_555172 [Laetiporus sulphureus 93-53]|uniref:Uncharacterized protein n=1 Tax=Laetiporus sulphureus 93-53 TaxID=1314785 RepID=A0A165B7M9_9APHY|nr:uncharacterized protein LAESUDRAFT_555172 [Laetiporus sulphureus 93-53]KZT00432.1 hypothetical protein LAESUDRAFT_555172 [Laetiporus sulphureus 93-53]